MAKFDQPDEQANVLGDGGHTAKLQEDARAGRGDKLAQASGLKQSRAGESSDDSAHGKDAPKVLPKTAKDHADEQTRGGEAKFVKEQHHHVRHLHKLPDTATSDELFHAMAHDGFVNATSSKYNAAFVEDSLKTMGLKKEGLTEDKFYDALVAFHRKENGLPPSASLDEIERAGHKKLYKDLKMGTVPVDTD
jgi:hypothetical protein